MIEAGKMPASGPIKLDIAGYTERHNKEAPYIEELKSRQSESNGYTMVEHNSSVRYVWKFNWLWNIVYN